MPRVAALLGLFALACSSSPSSGAPPGASPEARDPCAAPFFDLSAGTLAGLAPTATEGEVQAALACDPEVVENAVLYRDRQMFFQVGNDFIEVRQGFRGTSEPPLLGRRLEAAQAALGPVQTRESLGPGASRLLFDRPYGCLRVETREDTVALVAAHGTPCEGVLDILATRR
jgi:hypothetical protein